MQDVTALPWLCWTLLPSICARMEKQDTSKEEEEEEVDYDYDDQEEDDVGDGDDGMGIAAEEF